MNAITLYLALIIGGATLGIIICAFISSADDFDDFFDEEDDEDE